MSSNSVRVKEAILVKPSEPTPTQVLRLSALDSQLFLRFTVEYLLVYNPHPAGLDKSNTLARLKSALAKSLVPYYPLAGRVRARADGSGLEVVCRGQGAVFIEANSDCTVPEFERAPKYSTEWRKLLSLHVEDVLMGAPPLVVQLTWLEDGGATLGVGFSHCLCDGIGSGEFLNSFAELASGNYSKRISLKPTTPVIWSRHLMDPPTPFRQPPPYPAGHHHPEFKKVPDTCGFLNRFREERLVPTSITFDRKCLNELKRSAVSTSSSSTTCTSFEVLSAHIWRSWAKALNLPSKQIVKLLFSINIRNRVKPNLPNGYYGNAFVLGCAETSVKELTENGLGHATEMVKRAKERVDEGYVREVVESVSWKNRAVPDSVGVLILSQWSRLGLNRVDFGMGRPVEVGPVCCDRYCILLPVNKCEEREAVKVNLAVPTGAVDQYVHLLTRSPVSPVQSSPGSKNINT
ncbi:OLC1v1026855C1 [Oldenlandia corymbosa var. corymbosa]|uniref:OLC1v1026855C1 n=1 Tax=Oldenlandia corymbosa var. corymbosa TaxID=529605 RepID=A0AAV1CAS5_OLDCO|nr:OLC1v1026855C1 [Oldenlandia corymbosa var. corymbosa]